MKDFISVVGAVLLIAAIICGVASCMRAWAKEERARVETLERSVQKNNNTPTTYEIVFTNNDRDTIKVWGDDIYMDTTGGRDLLGRTSAQVALYYLPCRKYQVNEVNEYRPRRKLFNVVRFKKLK